MTSLSKTLIFLKLNDIYLPELDKFLYQLHRKKFKKALKDYFFDSSKIRSHNTITKHNLVYFKPRIQTSAGKKSRTFRGIELWGKIEPRVKELSWYDKKLSLHIIDKTKSYPKLYNILTFFASYLGNPSFNCVIFCINFLLP